MFKYLGLFAIFRILVYSNENKLLWAYLSVLRVGSALFELCGGIHDIHSLRFTSGVTPLPVYIASIAAGHFPHMRVSAEVGCRI